MIETHISITLVDSTPNPDLPTGVHHVSEVMPLVLDRYGLSLERDPNSVRSESATEVNDLLDVMIACLEAALAS
jgi:hypothetical protein